MQLSSPSSVSSRLFLPPKPYQIRCRRLYRRRRLKMATRSSLLPEGSVNFILPAIGFASGLAVYLSNRSKSDGERNQDQVCDVGEWVLFTSPTPFNRFVLLRCPSVFFEGSELLEDVNERLVEEERHFVRLVEEERHFVRLDDGRMQFGGGDGRGEFELEGKLRYQRVCVVAGDGGVISLDWPENLELEEERGLDTTVLLVPGTAEGSMDPNVRSFVCEAMKSGLFPVVMNPRGCAGSPLTTARLFTAADSDDVSTAIQFISKARPWTTFMGVGWGYGANMLTKYLAEVGEKTPLTAATCIDNPFDLQEASRASSRRISVDQKLVNGMKDILRSNKELFQGKTRGFDVEKALLAKSVRDFEKEISTVSCGFEALEEFYSKSSTRNMVGDVKVPVLFIQTDDDGTVPLFSIPRSLIAENPFTSLLLCSCSPPIVTTSDRSAISWSQHLTVEWLTAVELGLLKGRHPLLKDIDVTIRPSKELSLVDGRGRVPDSSANVDKFLDITEPNSSNGYSDISSQIALEETDTGVQSKQSSRNDLKLKDVGVQEADNDGMQRTGAVDAELVEDEEGSEADSESGQVFQTAKVVMSMLDKSMPGTLTEEKKRKVLDAVGQGETLVTALQNAVPEDVRGKLTTSVSAFVQTRGIHLKLDGLLRKGSDASSGIMPRIQENGGVLSSAEGSQDHSSSDHMKPTDNVEDNPDSNQLEKPVGSAGKDTSDQHNDNVKDNPDNNQLEKPAGSAKKDTDELGDNQEHPNFSGQPEGSKEAISDEHNDNVKDIPDNKELEKPAGSAKKDTDELRDNHEQPSSPSQPEGSKEEISDGHNDQVDAIAQVDVVDDIDAQKIDNKNLEPALDQTMSTSDPSSPNFSVTQAFDAFTGMDDSTQVAVNSVFGVIEDMITQLENSDDASEARGDNSKEKTMDTIDANHGVVSEDLAEKKEENKNGLGAHSDTSHVASVHNSQEIGMDPQHDLKSGCTEEQPMQNSIPLDRYCTDGFKGSELQEVQEENTGKLRYSPNIPQYITAHPYGGSLHNKHLHKYLLSKMPTASLDVDTTAALLFDYFPEEGQWKLLEQSIDMGKSIADDASSNGNRKRMQTRSPSMTSDIEPSYVVFDTEKQQHPISEYVSEEIDMDADISDEIIYFVRSIILESLKVEVDRKLSATDIEKIEPYLARDLKRVASAVSLAVGHDKAQSHSLEDEDIAIIPNSQKVGALNGECIVAAISSAVQETKYLRAVLPVGVIVGSSLAALRKFFDVAPFHSGVQKEASTLDQAIKSKFTNKINTTEIDRLPTSKSDRSTTDDSSDVIVDEAEEYNKSKDAVMAGAFTAALGASALLVQQKDMFQNNGTVDSLSKSLKGEGNDQKAVDTLGEALSENGQSNIVTSLAEKAMSVAGPMVPTKEGGEVDHERLVVLLTDLGQRGGMLRLVGKLALLWGGIRGAMSLTDKLISFLHLSERPLFQRILGFLGMTLVLWSPVVIPLLPTLMQCWMANTSSTVAELACVFALYAAILILVAMWGKRIRGFENPLQGYGLDMTSWPKIRDLLKGIVGGILLVLSIQSINSLLGYASFAWPPGLPSSSVDVLGRLKVYGHVTFSFTRGIVMATGIALAEELFFRSWLPEEIASDLGYHRGVIISGLVFALFQRSLVAIPGIWLLSLALSGARRLNEGSLSVPVGLRAGIIASCFILQNGGFLTYRPNLPIWLIGSHPSQPFSGLVGFAFALLFALSLYPRETTSRKKLT